MAGINKFRNPSDIKVKNGGKRGIEFYPSFYEMMFESKTLSALFGIGGLLSLLG